MTIKIFFNAIASIYLQCTTKLMHLKNLVKKINQEISITEGYFLKINQEIAFSY